LLPRSGWLVCKACISGIAYSPALGEDVLLAGNLGIIGKDGIESTKIRGLNYNEKRAPGCLGYIGDEALPMYEGMKMKVCCNHFLKWHVNFRGEVIFNWLFQGICGQYISICWYLHFCQYNVLIIFFIFVNTSMFLYNICIFCSLIYVKIWLYMLFKCLFLHIYIFFVFWCWYIDIYSNFSVYLFLFIYVDFLYRYICFDLCIHVCFFHIYIYVLFLFM